MIQINVPTVIRLLTVLLLLFPVLPVVGVAQVPEGDRETEIREVVVVGTRALPRSVEDSPVPVDTFGSRDFGNRGSSDLINTVRTLVPSFHVADNASRDMAALVRPINLRGLAPDHTLVLMNGKRRHRGSVIQWLSNGASNGAQGPDISVIPAIAVKRMEVLRDGAAAQYGSDAIAGVLNFILKDASEGASFETRYGAHTADSDEDLTTVAANIGLPLFRSGFANLSMEYAEAAPTSRSVQHRDAAALTAAGIPNVADPAKPWGSSGIRGSIKTVANIGVDLSDSDSLYVFGNYASREVETPFFFRSPMNRKGVYEFDPDPDDPDNPDLFLVGGEGCQAKYTVPSLAENVIDFGNRLKNDTGCYSFVEHYPEGFTPIFGARLRDYSAVVGMRGSLAGELRYDVSGSIGQHNTDGFLHNTINPSLGPDSPRNFDIGQYTQTETNVNVDLSYPVDVGMASDLHVAGGVEWHKEEFEIVAGEEASWRKGTFASDGFGIGSNGFAGFSPASAGVWSRTNIASYVDLEVEPADGWRVGGAVRWEDFDSFGNTTNFKLTSGIWLTDTFALRGSAGTGFRAPTPGQANARNVTTAVDAQTKAFEERATIGSTHPVAVALGGRELRPEESRNLSLGAVLALDNGLSLTMDFFRIDVDDRIALSKRFPVTDAIKRDLLAAGVEQAGDFDTIRYFTNDFDTRTQGVDVVLTYGWESGFGRTDLQLSFNYTNTEVLDYRSESTVADGNTIANLENGAPKQRIDLTLNHEIDQWDLFARYGYYGDWYDDHGGREFDGYGLVDVQARYHFLNGLSAALGAENVLDQYPDRNIDPGDGGKYPRYSPAGYNGALVYAKVSYSM